MENRVFRYEIILRMPELTMDCGLCRLRPFRMEDAGTLARHANNRKIAERLRDRFPHPYTFEDAKRFLSLVTTRDEDSREFVLAIEVAGEAIGAIGVVLGVDIERVSGELGYWLSE